MSSYFVAAAAPDAEAAVHDRQQCPPACFPPHHAVEYLGEFMDVSQAVAVARLRYAHAQGCTRPFAPSARNAGAAQRTPLPLTPS